MTHSVPTRRASDLQQKKTLAKLSPGQLKADKLAGTTIREVLDKAPGNDAPIGGIKVVADSGWFAARPSGTEDIYKIYGESFESREHLQAILAEAQGIVAAALERQKKVPSSPRTRGPNDLETLKTQGHPVTDFQRT